MKHLRLYENYDYEEVSISTILDDMVEMSGCRKPVMDSYKELIKKVLEIDNLKYNEGNLYKNSNYSLVYHDKKTKISLSLLKDEYFLIRIQKNSFFYNYKCDQKYGITSLSKNIKDLIN